MRLYIIIIVIIIIIIAIKGGTIIFIIYNDLHFIYQLVLTVYIVILDA